MFDKFYKNIKDILFPVFCLDCGLEGEWFCQSCLNKIKIMPVFLCPGCRKKNDGSLCLGCQGFFPLDGAISMFAYDEKDSLSRLILDFKYRFARDISRVWQKVCCNFFDLNYPSFLNTENQWTIIPVPLFPRRERERGYNQSEIIAKIICDEINRREANKTIMDINILKRTRPTLQQAKLSKEKRIKNIINAFSISAAKMPENVILIDDVFTSGVTLFECARILKLRGVKRVWGITLARGLFE